ncbi:DUF692 domain-containing protein [Mycolicibacterium llatzerense]|uniref:DUF692 domain-containing protein n=1 Tax=Mycolicibacterium llatzerense TaxID=280871 RepID=UPI0021B60C20|nr:DUF692 domain-containing protein [Mycolicibacterium llatzerense]
MSTAIGIGWRPEIDLSIERLPGVEFVEVIAEGIKPERLPDSLQALRARGVPVVPHGVSLSLGGAQVPEPARLAHLAACAAALDAPLVSEHIAFVRAGGSEAGHLLPVPRTRAALDVVVENVRIAQDALGVPLALEHVAAVLEWPDREFTEAQFLAEIAERTGALLLLDVANLYTSAVNFGADPLDALETLPLERIAYVHVAGGALRDGIWHDTHTADVAEPILDLLAELASRTTLPAVMLERDGAYPAADVLAGELSAIRSAVGRESAGTVSPWAAGLSRYPSVPSPHVPETTRHELAVAQCHLLNGLLGLADPPPGFDADRVALARTVLTHKRAHSLTKMSLGAKFRRKFAPKLTFGR